MGAFLKESRFPYDSLNFNVGLRMQDITFYGHGCALSQYHPRNNRKP